MIFIAVCAALLLASYSVQLQPEFYSPLPKDGDLYMYFDSSNAYILYDSKGIYWFCDENIEPMEMSIMEVKFLTEDELFYQQYPQYKKFTRFIHLKPFKIMEERPN